MEIPMTKSVYIVGRTLFSIPEEQILLLEMGLQAIVQVAAQIVYH
jgi:hypothetical protein